MISNSLRRYIGLLREENLISSIQERFCNSNIDDFQLVSVEPHPKDGGVFVKFRYNSAIQEDQVEQELRERARKHGGLPSWIGRRVQGIWLVRGSPWKEDMNRFASPIIKVAFEGPDVHEESLYRLLRPYGRIQEITEPTPVPAGTLRSSIVSFDRVHSATIARNVMHGFQHQSTRLRCMYQYPIQGHAIRDWLSKHPKIVLPIVFFLIGTLTYTIFDPIRVVMVEGKMLDWFSLQEFALYKWLRANTFDRLYTSSSDSNTDTSSRGLWKERKDAEAAINAYLTDLPSTVTFIHGPQGSGKTSMVESVLKDTGRVCLVIDCRELQKATSDTQLVDALAKQTGYWPIFSFLSSMNNLIDLASVGLIGQKAGLSSSIEEQLQEILDVVATALKNISASHRANAEKGVEMRRKYKTWQEQEERRREAVKAGIWHDGRLDCVAGNGVMSELGIGDESFSEADSGYSPLVGGEGGTVERRAETEKTTKNVEKTIQKDKPSRKQKSLQDIQALEALPIVVIRNFATKGGLSREQLMDVLAKWAAKLTESQIAHVIVISDNRENSKRLAKALPSKPLNSVAIYDADAASALSYVQQKLRGAEINVQLTSEETSYLERLGGRSSDLESLIHKVRNGQSVKDAVEDIIYRGVAELRKSAFGDDSEDAKNLPWTREQAWTVLKLLSQQAEVPYHEVLLNFPFKGDESPLRNMEQAELISIGTYNGRPSVIRPGRPVYRWVFERLVSDKIFQAIQEITYNEAQISSAESSIKSCEEELLKLKDIGWNPAKWFWNDPPSRRAEYLMSKMMEAERKLEVLERKNGELKKALAKGG
ncbi:mitochondrial escape protein 2 [Paramarasmius palmivorus]|uniref:Mitochondrial escape protein 2 n=1 Tax=Paramarasmius palmivorus TaxID=297713 RepID=A0AAW0AUW7_9AGAR